MSMENSSALHSDSGKHLSPPIEEVSTSKDEQIGVANADNTHKFKGGLDTEGDFVDAETVMHGMNSPEPTSADANPWNSGGADGGSNNIVGEDVHEDEGGSVESFDSASERIATASNEDPTSPVGPSSPFLEAGDSVQQNALRRLNLLINGVSSLDTTLLENTSSSEFKRHVTQIIEANGLSVDGEELENILAHLTPLVEKGQKKDEGIKGGGDTENEVEDEAKSGAVIPNQVEDEPKGDGGTANEAENGRKGSVDPANDAKDDEDTTIVDSSKQEGDLIIVQSEDLNTVPGKSEEIVDKVDLTQNTGLAPLNHNERDENDVPETSENGGSISETQVNKVGNYTEEEPEVVKGDSLHESYARDEVVNVPSQSESVFVLPLGQELGASEAPFNPAEAQDALEQDKDSEHSEAVELDLIHVDGTESGNASMVESTEEGKVEDAGHNEEEAVNDDGDNRRDLQEKEMTLEDKASSSVGTAEKLSLYQNLMVESEPKDVSEDTLKDEGMKEQETTLGETTQGLLGTAEDGDAAVVEPRDVSEDDDFQAVEANPAEELSAVKEEPDHGASKLDPLDNADKGKVSDSEKSIDNADKRKSSSSDEKSTIVHSAADTRASSLQANDVSSLGAAGPSLPARPAGLGRSVPPLEHAPRAVQRSTGPSPPARQSAATGEERGSNTDVSDGSDDSREQLQTIRVKFLRLAHRLGQSAQNVVVAQVLYRLGLAEQLRGGGRGTGRAGAFSFERASALAEEQEAAGVDDLEFGCTIMVLGKSGVGKSATINSLFDEVKSGTNAYRPATNKVQEIIGTVHGIKLRVIDTPGLLYSFTDQRRNERIMASVKRFIKKSPPDIVLYFDRLDMQGRDYGDLPLLRTITHTLGSAIWFNAIVVLTHASSAPPDGANGVPVSYEMFVAQRSHVVQQTIRQAAGDMRLMNPVSLVENHTACRRNRVGKRVLPNGQVWVPQLLLLCFASKILAEANTLLKLQDSTPAKPFGVRSRVPPLPLLLSSLLQSRAPLKLPDEQVGTDDESDDDSDKEADSEGEEYDDLPPFRRLTKEELKLLDKEQRKIYAEELEYREKLFMKKQLKDEWARKKEMKRRLASLPKDIAQQAGERFEEENAPASVPVPMPDMALPPSFDSDAPTYRYRYLETANQWLVRPMLETHGWDHDSGYDGLNVEKMFVVSKKVPVSVSGQVTKDKKEANLQMECAASFNNGEGKATQAGLDIQTIGKDLVYTLRSETRFNNFKRNRTTCGLAVTLLGDTMAAGMKIEDRLLVGKRAKLVLNGGALTGRRDVAYGGSLEVTVRDKDYPVGQFMSTVGLSVMDWHGDLAIGGNAQLQCKVGKTMVIGRGNVNNRRAGQISIRVNSSEQLQMALIGLIPLLRTFINNRVLSSN